MLVDRETERIWKSNVANNKADEKRRETLTQCAGLMEEVTEKGVHHMATFSLGQIKNIYRYHFGSNAYRDEENKKDHKKAWLLIEAKRLVEAHRGSAGGDGDGEEYMFSGVLV